jgi:DMSO/TMAO reductase YedYZ molybdopterin-dependent catalytic subunit
MRVIQDLCMAPALAMRGRMTNLTLLMALLLTFATGVGAVATGSASGRWVVIAHGVVGIGLVLLIPWKSQVIRRGLRRRRPSRWASLLLASLAVTTLLLGLGHTTGLLRSVGGVAAMWLHIAVALALAPLAIWHIVARRVRVRRADLSRRLLLRAGVLGAAAAGLYVASGWAVALAAPRGARRRFTGSYETGSFDPPSMPNTIWLDDSTPSVDPGAWRLTIVDGTGRYELTLSQLRLFGVRLRATLDCTSGWYAHQDWTGAPISALLRELGDARSVLVHSVTGYWVRFPMHDVSHLLLATDVGGQPLSTGHGFPARLVAPDRRGFWWVKWVDRIELQSVPAWWQPPFPLT